MITLVGNGALGSHTLLFLRNVKLPLRVIDFDGVESKNVMAQMHTNMSLGQNKAVASQRAMQGMFGKKIEAIPHKLDGVNAKTLLASSKLVVDCTDNIAARKIIQEAAKTYEFPCLHASVSADGTFARILWTEHFVPDQETPGVATCEDGAALPFFGLVGAHVAHEALEFLKSGSKRSFQLTPTSLLRLV